MRCSEVQCHNTSKRERQYYEFHRLAPESTYLTTIIFCECSFGSGVWFFVIPWTVSRQAPLSMKFSRQEYWSGLPFPTPGDLPNAGIKTTYPVLAGGFFTTEKLWSILLKHIVLSLFPFLPLFSLWAASLWVTLLFSSLTLCGSVYGKVEKVVKTRNTFKYS